MPTHDSVAVLVSFFISFSGPNTEDALVQRDSPPEGLHDIVDRKIGLSSRDRRHLAIFLIASS